MTITGTGFLAGATVTIGGNAATNVVVGSGKSITAVTGAHRAPLKSPTTTTTPTTTPTSPTTISPVIVVTRLSDATTIRISLPKRYARKHVTIELGLSENGQVKFHVVGKIVLDASGKGVLSLRRVIPSNATVRATIDSRIVAERVRTTRC